MEARVAKFVFGYLPRRAKPDLKAREDHNGGATDNSQERGTGSRDAAAVQTEQTSKTSRE